MASCSWGHSWYPRSLAASWTLCSSDCEFLIMHDSLADQQEHIHTVSRLHPPRGGRVCNFHMSPCCRQSTRAANKTDLQESSSINTLNLVAPENHTVTCLRIAKMSYCDGQCRIPVIHSAGVLHVWYSYDYIAWFGRVGSNWKQG